MSLVLLPMLMMKQVLWALTSQQQLAPSQGCVWIQMFEIAKDY